MKSLYCWAVAAILLVPLAGCGMIDIGSPNDMAKRQDKMRQNRTIPTATELPPGLGEDLPQATPPPAPMTSNQ